MDSKLTDRCTDEASSKSLEIFSYHHVDDRGLASVGFETALQRILEFFGFRYLLAVAPNGFGDLHEVGRVDVRAVMEIDLPSN